MFTKLAFTAESVDDQTFNLFGGLGCEPIEGDCSLIRQHILEVLCAGDSRAATAFEKLVAWQVRNIGTPSRIIPVLVSKRQQAGKGMFMEGVLKPIFGEAFRAPGTLDSVTGRFCSALRGAAVLFLDEVLFGGDRKAADALKRVSTASAAEIEEKGAGIATTPTGVNLWLASNHDAAAHIEDGDARYWILRVAEHRIGDRAYFSSLHDQIKNGGVEAFLHHLLSLDISDFYPQSDVPRDNEARKAMRRAAISDYDPIRWLEACTETGAFIGGKYEAWPVGEPVRASALYDAYREWARSIRGRGQQATATAFGIKLRELGFEKTRSSSGNVMWLLPALDELEAMLKA